MPQFTSYLLPALALVSSLAQCSPVARRAAHNNFDCRSDKHPNPVVLIHGLGATYYEDINLLEAHLQSKDFCTFSITYGAYPEFPLVGGLKPIEESSKELADFVEEVHTKTGAKKVDLVGHSEGAFQSLYVPKFRSGVEDKIQRVFAIAPPTHGTTFLSLYNLTSVGSELSRPAIDKILKTVGCAACSDVLPNGDAVARLTDGPIAQEGISYTILTSKNDQLVKPTTTSFVREEGVRNLYVQDFCPFDQVGHIGEAYDLNVWTLVVNSLQDNEAGPKPGQCVVGFPGR
ncbi:hypothetical protein Q7P37_008120 [Cladosporium fusiforme]